MPILPVVFAGGPDGGRHVRSISAVAGESLPAAERVAVLEGARVAPPQSTWALANLRGTEEWSYVDREVDIRLDRGAGP
jgi:hypothetical protein